MIDILYLAKGRPEFTSASLHTLLRNTDWRTARLSIYTDGDSDAHVRSIVATRHWPLNCVNRINTASLGGPINIMLEFLKVARSNVFAKIDNDVIVPPRWLETSIEVMQSYPELDLLGLEPALSRTQSPWGSHSAEASPESRYAARHSLGAGPYPAFAASDSIGGVGIIRKNIFDIYPDMTQHSLYGGFSDWQLRHSDVVKGWIVPPLRLFLLDRLNFSPWKELSAKYIASGEQRPWTMYSSTSSHLWQWWLDEESRLLDKQAHEKKQTHEKKCRKSG